MFSYFINFIIQFLIIITLTEYVFGAIIIAGQKKANRLAEIINRASSGDIILIKSGIYLLKNQIKISNKKRIIIKNFTGDLPVLKYIGNEMHTLIIDSKSKHITIKGLKIVRSTNANGNVITVAGKNIKILNCEIYFDPKFLPTKYDGIKILSTARNILIKDCIIHNCPQQGIDTVGGKFIVINNNIIYNSGNAIVLKGGTTGNLIENNVCFNLKYGAIGLGGFTAKKWINYEHEISNTVVRRNIVWYDDANSRGGGIFLAGAYKCLVINNTLYGSGIRLYCGGDPHKPQFCCQDNQIINNIIVCTGNDGIICIEDRNEKGLQLLNNLYWKSKKCTGEFKVKGRWYSYKEFKTLFDFDKNSIFENPKFVDEKLRNFYLKPESPCIDKGYIVRNFKIRYNGAAPDIGAIEFGKSWTDYKIRHKQIWIQRK